jgi:ABC-type multidrug transport system permease subunit
MKSKNYFVIAAFASFVFSVTLWFCGDTDLNRSQAIFVGLWVPSILSLGNLLNG